MLDRGALVIAVALPDFAWHIAVAVAGIAVLVAVHTLFTSNRLDYNSLFCCCGASTPTPKNDTPHTLYSAAFVWPDGDPWGKRPRMHAECLIEDMTVVLRADPRARFVVHVHGAVPATTRNELMVVLSSRYTELCSRTPNAHELHMVLCDKNRPWEWPLVQQLVPLFDESSSVATVCVLAGGCVATKTNPGMLLQFKACGVTQRRRDVVSAPEPSLMVDSTSLEIESGVKWRVCAGGCQSLPSYRALHRSANANSFSVHAEWCAKNVAMAGMNTGSLVLEQFLVEQDNTVHLSLLRAHAILANSTKPGNTDRYPSCSWSEMQQTPKYNTTTGGLLELVNMRAPMGVTRHRALKWQSDRHRRHSSDRD